MKLLSSAIRLLVVISFILLVAISAVFARSWSYHYHPVSEATPVATPTAVAPNASEPSAKLLKRAIVSDLAVFAQNHNLQPRAGYSDPMEYVTSQLLLFDGMNSPEALSMFASLSGYYLGAPPEKLYQCLALRKAKAVEPLLRHYLHYGNPECINELGQDFSKPSASLDGYALCSNSRQQEQRLTDLIARIDNGESCADSELARISGSGRK
jgi:hypothetical protein